MPKEWCAFTNVLCMGHPEYHDEVSGEWWCAMHAGPLSWGERELDTYLEAWLEAA